MSSDDANGTRTHEPSLRELTAELDGLRELMDERNKWYGERDKDRQTAVDKALAAVEKQTAAAFEAAKENSAAALAAQKEAIVKEEEKQKQYNTSHNDLARKMDDQSKATMPRSEAQQRFDSQAKEISEIKAIVAAMVASTAGLATGGKAVKDESRANLGLILAVASVLSGLVAFLVTHWK